MPLSRACPRVSPDGARIRAAGRRKYGKLLPDSGMIFPATARPMVVEALAQGLDNVPAGSTRAKGLAHFMLSTLPRNGTPPLRQ
jgi:hypothetical protein